MISEPIPFLANIVIVSHANGKLSASELGQLESIRAEFKFKKGDFNAAVRLVQQGNHEMTPVGSFADQVRNLELILRVAYADDDLNDAEASLVNDFCKAIGVYQDQLEKLRGEVLASLKQHGKVCPSCGACADAEARFCPRCGVSLTVADESVQVEMTVPNSGLAFEFAESTAASFSKALELAKATEGFQSCQKHKKVWYLAVYPSGDLKEALPLVVSLSGIRNRRVHIDGQEKPWDEVFGFAWCAKQRAGAYRPLEYCFGRDENRLNPWGCKQARMDWTEWANWFCYGRWEKAGILKGKLLWRFDKAKIRHELTTNLFRYRFCPYLRAELSDAVLRYLPETVVPDSDSAWGYHRQYEQVPGSIKVIEKESSGDFPFTNEFWADGVRPKGLQVLTDILSKAFQDLGGSPISVDNLLK
jgi:hypothetical protein